MSILVDGVEVGEPSVWFWADSGWSFSLRMLGMRDEMLNDESMVNWPSGVAFSECCDADGRDGREGKRYEDGDGDGDGGRGRAGVHALGEWREIRRKRRGKHSKS